MSIYINSRDRPPNQNADKATYRTNVRQDGVGEIGLASYDFLTQFDNINSVSGTSYIETSSQTFPVVLDNGWYDYTDLATEITTQCAAQAPTVGVVCSFIDYKFEITATTAMRFIFNPVQIGAKSWSIMIGAPHDGILQHNITCGVADINYTNALFILSNSVCKRSIKHDYGSNSNVSNVLGVVYLYEDRQEIEGKDKSAPQHATQDLSAIKFINFDVRDPVATVDIEILDERGLVLPDELKTQFTYVMELRYN